MNRDDLELMARALKADADLIDDRGKPTWDKLDEWQRGPKAARTEAGGGWRYEEDDNGVMWAIPNDQTGEAVIHPDAAHDLFDEFRKLHDRVSKDTARIRRIIHMVPSTSSQKRRDDDPGPDWCKSCYRDAGYLEPVATHPDGSVKYAGYCRWCRESPITPPPLELVRTKHAGKRISVAMWERATGQRIA